MSQTNSTQDTTRTPKFCFRADQLLFQIVGGRLHVEFKTSNWNDRQMPDGSKQRYDGWFPGNEGPGKDTCQSLPLLPWQRAATLGNKLTCNAWT